MNTLGSRSTAAPFIVCALLLALLVTACTPEAIQEVISDAVESAAESSAQDGKPESSSGSQGDSDSGSPSGDGKPVDSSPQQDEPSSDDSSSSGDADSGQASPQGLDYSLFPNYGQIDLESGFTPDPHTLDMLSGGSVDASYLDNPDCNGYATPAPDFRIYWSGDSNRLRFFFVGEGDTTLIINEPSGAWYCNDDSFSSMHPTVTFNSPNQGQYDIWVGSFGSGDFIPGTLYITELDAGPEDSQNGTPITGDSDFLDFSLSPNYGEMDLESGFTPDPYTLSMTSGGTVDASYLDNPECTGYATSAPDFRIYWGGDSSRLRFFFEGDGDTTLIINEPSGDWYCNDDSFSSIHPTVTFISPNQGQYDIWVGSYSSGEYVSGTLGITELDIGPGGSSQNGGPNTGDGGFLDYSLAPNYGEMDLESGFTPDPYTLNMSSGGTVDATYLDNPDCNGYATSAPDFRIYWSGDSNRLRFFFDGDGDTTLIINEPSGNWYCNDDSFGSMHPTITLSPPSQGQYDIWVGSYSSGEYVSGTLYITELDINP